MNGWLYCGYALVVYCGLRFLDGRNWGQLDAQFFPLIFVLFVDVSLFLSMVELGVPFLWAIPLTSLITMSLCKLTSSKFIQSIWLSSIYLTLWIYIILALFYFISFFAIGVAGLGGLSEGDDPYYH